MRWPRVISCLLLILLLPLFAEAKKFKAPKWKTKGFVTTASGVRANVIKPGKDPKPKAGDYVTVFIAQYDYKTKKPFPTSKLMQDPKRGGVLKIEDGTQGLELSIMQLGTGGKGYFVFKTNGDSSCFYIQLLSITPGLALPTDTVPKDTVNFVIKDPAQATHGDSIFTSMKLVEVPKTIACSGKPVLEAFKFRITWFESGVGVQHKDILVYIECPEAYGAGFFVAGNTYVVTAIPLLEDHKQGKSVFNMYQGEKAESYLCLRVVKK